MLGESREYALYGLPLVFIAALAIGFIKIRKS